MPSSPGTTHWRAAAASPPDRHGYFSLGVSADYTASFIGRGRFFLEVTDAMPRTFGRNQIHVSQVTGWCRTDRPLVQVPPKAPDPIDTRLAAFVAATPAGAHRHSPRQPHTGLFGGRDRGITRCNRTSL